MLIGDIATNNARRYPDKRALVDAGRELTWSQVDERSRRLAHHLVGQGLQPGDRVMVIARNCIEWPEISFGLARAGLIAIPVNIRLAPDEVAHVRNDCGARAVIIHADHVERFRGELDDLDVVTIGPSMKRCSPQPNPLHRRSTSRRTTSRSSSTRVAPGAPRA